MLSKSSKNAIAAGIWPKASTACIEEKLLSAKKAEQLQSWKRLDAVKPAYNEAVAAGNPVGLELGLTNSGLGNGFKEIAKAVVHFREVRTTNGAKFDTAGPK